MSLITIQGVNISIQGRLIRIARLDAEKYQFLNDPGTILDDLKSSGVRADLFTFMQSLRETTPKYNYPMEWDNLAAISISTFDEWWTHQLGFKARNKAKQATNKGVKMRELLFGEELVRGVWEVYNECPVRQGKPFRHYGKDMPEVRDHLATYLDSSIFIGAFLHDKMIGFAKLVMDQAQTQAGLMHVVSMVRHWDLAPSNAIVAQAVRSCADRGIQHLVYSNFSYGKKLRDSLADFKERNGFRKVNLPRYYVPLTRLGSIALRLNLHHRVSERIPENVASRIRKLRTSWYERNIGQATSARAMPNLFRFRKSS